MPAKPLLNYTTSVDPAKTFGDIARILAGHGASEITQMLDRGRPVGVRFVLAAGGRPAERYALPVRPARVLEVLRGQVKARVLQPRYATPEQAERVAWRIAKDWLDAQLAIVASGMVTMDEVMIPYMVDQGGQTVFEHYLAAKQLEGPR